MLLVPRCRRRRSASAGWPAHGGSRYHFLTRLLTQRDAKQVSNHTGTHSRAEKRCSGDQSLHLLILLPADWHQPQTSKRANNWNAAIPAAIDDEGEYFQQQRLIANRSICPADHNNQQTVNNRSYYICHTNDYIWFINFNVRVYGRTRRSTFNPIRSLYTVKVQSGGKHLCFMQDQVSPIYLLPSRRIPLPTEWILVVNELLRE